MLMYYIGIMLIAVGIAGIIITGCAEYFKPYGGKDDD